MENRPTKVCYRKNQIREMFLCAKITAAHITMTTVIVHAFMVNESLLSSKFVFDRESDELSTNTFLVIVSVSKDK